MMARFSRIAILLLILAGCGTSTATDAVPDGLFDAHPPARLERFGSRAAFDRYLAGLPRREPTGDVQMYDIEPPPDLAEAPAEQVPAAAADMAGQGRLDSEPGNPSITNNQTVGVDEGGIVKQIGRFLVVLQDGRLFSADIGSAEGDPLRLIDRVDVYRSRETAADWYDEMLVRGDRILVTAYDYREAASEISVFRLSPDGRIAREGRFLISSDDYYSTLNYSTRLVGDSLVFYAPLVLGDRNIPSEMRRRGFRFPRLRRAGRDGQADEGAALIGPAEVYAPPGVLNDPLLHTVSVCPLRGTDLDCRTTAFVGGASREIYVTPTDVFLWVAAPDGMPWSIEYGNQRRRQCRDDEFAVDPRESAAMVYRVPLDGGEIGAVAVRGHPPDQFALDSRDGRFRALLGRPAGECDRFDSPHALSLLDIPLAAFRRDVRHVAATGYTSLPPPAGGMVRSRFVGDWLLYGGVSPVDQHVRGPVAARSLVAVPLARPAAPLRLAPPHDILRIEAVGNDAVITGYGDPGGVSVSYVALGAAPRIAATTVLAGRYESEARSHGFGSSLRGDGTRLLGLPTSGDDSRSGRGWSASESSELSFIVVAGDHGMRHAGELAPARRGARAGYECHVSCVDWYGNSRPIFTGGRTFALMGTDLVEGALRRGRIAEIGRLDLTGAPGRTSP